MQQPYWPMQGRFKSPTSLSQCPNLVRLGHIRNTAPDLVAQANQVQLTPTHVFVQLIFKTTQRPSFYDGIHVYKMNIHTGVYRK